MVKPCYFSLVMAAVLSPLSVQAEQAFELGRIEVTAKQSLPGSATTTVDVDTLREENRETVDAALDRLPGVTKSFGGQRSEAMVSVRGFDLRQVPILVDGIPVYVPYDGYVDLGRFTTFDLSEISVSKSFSSPLLGANTLGGAINLVSRRPVKKLEGEVGAGYNTGDHTNSEGKRTWLNLGTNQGLWYGQFSASYRQSDSFSLSDDFDPSGNADGQGSGVRNNAERKDNKINIKLGLTPNNSDEYVVGYIKQDGQKNTPPYTGLNPDTQVRYWQWPYWDKESVYLLTNTALSDDSYIKTRLYYDTFKNKLESYDDNRYATQTRGYAFTSIYDDQTYGASAEYGKTLGQHQLKFAAHYKFDEHKEHDENQPESKYQDKTLSFGVEDTFTLTHDLYLVLGASYDRRKTVEAMNYLDPGYESFDHKNNDSFNPQIGLFAELDKANQARITLSQKSRFPTIKDRYSYRMGSAIPNPDLKQEKATTLEVGWVHKLSDFGRIETSIFQSKIDDLIQSTNIGLGLDQYQNIGEVDARGLELSADFWIDDWELGGNYSYLARNNRSSSARLTNTPRHKLFAYASWHITQPLSLSMTTQYESERYNDANPGDSAGLIRKSDDFILAGLRATYAHPKGITTRIGIENLFDKDYSYDEGFPEQGRTYYANVSYQF